MSSQYQLDNLIKSLQGKRVLILTTSNRWEGDKEIPKSSILAKQVAEKTNSVLIDVSSLHIEVCEGNVSTAKGNKCGLKDSALKDTDKNPSGHHRCWASFNNADDELWKISKELFQSDAVLFFASVRWGQTNSIYQKLIERLNWIENRWSTLQEDNIVKNIEAGIVLIGHNWNGHNVLEVQKEVLKYYGFIVPDNLSFNWQWTNNALDETAIGYEKDPLDFADDFGLAPVFVNEDYKKWFNGFPTFMEILKKD
jgi:multimeric flavodoxin WrbA